MAAYCRFAPGAAHELGELLRAAAAYAAGGMKALAALQARSTSASRLIGKRDNMLALVIGFFVLGSLFIAAKWFIKSDPKQAARGLRYMGGGAALMLAGFLLVRSSSAPS